MDGDGPGGGAARAEDGSPLARPAGRWPLSGLALVALASFAAAVLVSIGLVLLGGIGRQPAEQRGPAEILVLTVLSDAALVLVLLALGRARLGLRLRDLGFRRPPLGALQYAAGVAAALWLLSIAVNAVSIRVFGPHPQSLVVTVGAHAGITAYVLDIVTGALVAPFAEETLYRGLVFGGLVQRIPFPAAAGVSALLFAASHGLGVIVPIFVLGVGLAYVYWRTGTIWASMAAHSLVNAVSLTLLFLQPK